MSVSRNTGTHSRRIPIPMEMRLSRRHRARLVVEGALVGLCAGVLITAYRFFLSHAEESLRFVVSLLSRNGLQVVWFAVLAVLLLAVGRLMLWEPYTQGSGIPQVDAEVAGKLDMPWRRVIPAKFLEGILSAFAGLSLGREGPSVQLGAMAGKGVARGLGHGRVHERLLTTCGAAAGISAAFNAPLSGVLFAIEEIHKEFSAALIISVMTTSVVADFVSSRLLGVKPVIHFANFNELPLELYGAVVLMGVLCGVLGALHNRGLFLVQEKLFDRINVWAPYARLAIPFALAGVVAFVAPELMCGGDAIIERFLLDAHGKSLAVILALLAGKYVFTCICAASGAPGGTLLPLTVMGALAGAAFGLGAVNVVGVSSAFVSEFTALGITGLFASVIQAPVTAVVLVFELTGSLNALLAASVVAILSYVTATLLNTEPFFEHLYARLLGTDVTADAEADATSNVKVLRTYVVGVGSAVEHKAVHEVPWPKGSLVVTLRRAGVESVVHGDTRIAALDELCVLMYEHTESQSNESLERLCESRDTVKVSHRKQRQRGQK